MKFTIAVNKIHLLLITAIFIFNPRGNNQQKISSWFHIKPHLKVQKYLSGSSFT